jgi:hypothetical protein
MFRGGGKIESRGTGITSGLEDRPGYQDGPGPNVMDKVKSEFEDLQSLKNQLGLYAQPETKTTLGLTRPELLKLAQRSFEFASKGGDETLGQKLTGSVSDALGDISASMLARKEKQKELDREKKLLQAGDLETIYAAGKEEELAKIKADADLKSKTYNVEIEDALIQKLNENIFSLEDELNNTTDEAQKNIIKQKIKNNKDRLSNIIKGDTTFLDFFLRRDEAQGGTFGQIVEGKILAQSELKKLDPVADKKRYDELVSKIAQLDKLIAEYASSISEIQDQLQGGFKEGGRVGLENGGEVTEIEKSNMPSFDLLRSRLPESVSNEVVTLLSVSPQALSDFASIKTEQDIEDFNQTYQVNLAVPTVS